MSVLLSVFLLIFVLLGIYPAWKRTATRLRRLLREQEKAAGTGLPGAGNAPASIPVMPPDARHLNDYETFVLRQLALAGGKGLSRRQLIESLHFDPAIIKQTLHSLVDRGLISIGLSALLRIRFSLSARGRAYAVAQGYIPGVH